MKKRKNEYWYWIVSEVAFFGFLYYLLMLLGIAGRTWLQALILFVLLNIAIIFCPILRGKY